MVVTYHIQAQNDYTELLFSLRSLEKYFIKPYEVVVIGNVIPDWLHNVIQISVPDIVGRKQLTIKNKIAAALRFYDEVFSMMDDIYLLQPTDGKSYPYYYHGTLKTATGESGARPLMEELLKRKKSIKHFDTHAPILYDRRFIKVFEYLPSDVIVKSAFCNYLDINGEYYADLKINKKTSVTDIERSIQGRNYFSTGPSGLSFTLPILQKLFPEKSIFEV